MDIVNFYCVKNEATKNDKNENFVKYCELRDGSKAYYIKKDCSRKWMNMGCDERGSSGISILWPNVENEDFKAALKNAKEGKSPNNISPIMKYSLEDGAVVLWMGDIESDLMEKIKDEVEWPEVDILFAPHHGRDSGKIPEEILKKLNPKIIIIGEASSSRLNYYQGYNSKFSWRHYF
ncbi:hypothetical protein ABE244_28080 [Bacillus toyonensis]|uniref:hypothetical protein n=1 Tax=Bacillus toyonensis TaxID=155322 RepID=UPI003D230303